MAQMEKGTQQNVELVEQTTEAVHSLLDQSDSMAGLINKFKLSDVPSTSRITRHVA